MYLGQEIGQVHANGSFMQDFPNSLYRATEASTFYIQDKVSKTIIS